MAADDPVTRSQAIDFGLVLEGFLLLTLFNFNPSMDKYLHAQGYVGWNHLLIPKLRRLNRWSLGMDK